MRLSLSLVFAIFLLLNCKENSNKIAADSQPESAPEQIEVKSPPFQDLEGNAITLSDFKGKRILLNYWATWCRPCIEEMPSMLRLQELLSEENYVFLLASDQSVATISKFKEVRGFDFNFIKFNGAYSDLQINALPVTIVYNEAGEEVDRITGATEWDAPEMVKKLKAVH